MTDLASILFPNDVPGAPAAVPAYVEVNRYEAEQRLQRKAEPDGLAAALFPNEGKGPVSKTPSSDAPAGKTPDELAKALFPEQAAEDAKFSGAPAEDFLTGYAVSAFEAGDRERGLEIKQATADLNENFRKAGAPTETLAEAFQILQSNPNADRLSSTTPAENEQGMADTLAGLRTELGSSFEADIGRAQRFMQDLMLVSPGIRHTLEHKGAGNDPRMVRAAIREARRRGY